MSEKSGFFLYGSHIANNSKQRKMQKFMIIVNILLRTICCALPYLYFDSNFSILKTDKSIITDSTILFYFIFFWGGQDFIYFQICFTFTAEERQLPYSWQTLVNTLYSLLQTHFTCTDISHHCIFLHICIVPFIFQPI